MSAASWLEILFSAGAVIGLVYNVRILRFAYGDRQVILAEEGPAQEGLLIMANILLRMSRFFVVMLAGFLMIGVLSMLIPSRPDLEYTPLALVSVFNFTFWMVLLEVYAIYWGWAYLRDRARLAVIAGVKNEA